ncbi:MAG: HTTM domain-containing protein [Anaerolineae bacterium]|nr:HTTM domain-containing protein [Anaerolineae bacterium]
MTVIKRLQEPTSIWPLVIFRIVFGLLMFGSTVRFMTNGWIETFYLQPAFHFTYYGFGWVKPLPGLGLYAVYAALALLALSIAAGLLYRPSISLFFLLFTYTELLDKTYYLNHYYFISLLSFLLIFLPLHRRFALDTLLWPSLKTETVPVWTIAVIQWQLGLVYFFAGLAKLEYDWLFRAMPLKIWLAGRTDFPLLGGLFDTTWFPFVMSWAGALYDLTILFFLLYRPTRPLAYLTVIGFHLMTGLLFNIGMFPYIMIACTLIFFSADEWRRVAYFVLHIPYFGLKLEAPCAPYAIRNTQHGFFLNPALLTLLTLFFTAQLLLPLRHWLYPGDVLWTEEGFRFSWMVMLVEKTGHVTFEVTNPATGRRWTVFPGDYLTYPQEKQMSFQPDMMLEFAHHLETLLRQQGLAEVEVRAEAYVSLNGRPSRLLVDPTVDLTTQQNSLWPKRWILPRSSSATDLAQRPF